MARFRVEGDGFPSLTVESESWMGALGDVLERYAIEDTSGVECDVLPEGDIAVHSPRGRFVLQEFDEAAAPGPRLGPTAVSVSPELLDAPDVAHAPAWRTREAASDDDLADIQERSRGILDGETADVACALALDLLMEHVPAESGAVLLADRRTRDLRFIAARGPRARGLVGVVVPVGRGIAGLTVRAGMALTIREAAGDPRHFAEVDQRTGYHTHTILSVPVRGPHGPIGCIQLLNPFAGATFLPWHQTAVQVVAARIAERVG